MHQAAIIIAWLILFSTLALILSEKLPRSVAAMLGGFLMVAAGLIFGFYNEHDAILSIDFNTLGLLLGMMILVALLETTGFFQFIAIKAAQMSRGKPVLLLFMLGGITSIVSMFLDNVTTVVLIAPVTILVSEIMGINPLPYLMAEAMLSNIGGVATLVGDPPNVLIASAAGFTFVDFLVHSLPIVIVVWFSVLGLIRWLFRKELDISKETPGALQGLDPKQAFKDRKGAVKVIVMTSIAVLFFLLEDWIGITPSMIALGAATLAVIWVSPSFKEVLRHIEWEVLVFFAGLFICVGGVEAAGGFDILAGWIHGASSLPPGVFGLIILWLVALLSAFVDNVPITIAMIPIILSLESSGIPVQHLWWAVVFGAGFGGNGTVIGSTANVVVAGLSEKTRHPITPRLWSKRGFPAMILSCLVASVLYLVLINLMMGV